ncbi:ABC transporter ATP-binding protein [Vibrio tapetis]|uniref:sn-glycerol-3-phosphate import ATP-binding protein UgpC n=1 Tax=Vibrio tapetis subsp. tapetis TaxID=1671868 RepID=A0A2N8ZMV7_9VIBR|nr:sn-glycerol-3-phosphate ABC transporter ATP-binding protein UgpC [Vibrio tapetis]SON53222.1 sn-glycerol-3-phosphate import ATP-binding protein UgpC [Vibrio tapetis subsp. tapetis]
MARVVLDNMNKVYDNGFHAIRDVSLEIEDGEFMVLVGPSGCAKSTMLRLIAGLENVTSGELSIGERICNNLAPKDRGIAMVFQNYALYPHMTAYENMAFGLETAKKPKSEIEKRVAEASELLEIQDLLDRKPKQMSGGQRQRVALGRAMVRKPEVFLFDEPLSNLDAKLRVSMRMRITRLHQELKSFGKPATMVYVTHDQVEAMTMGDRVCILNKGQIMQVDTPMNVYRKPKNKFVAEFIGSPSMNMFSATLCRHDNKLAVCVEDKPLFIPEDKQNKAVMWLDHAVHLGIRPEDLKINDQPCDGSLEATVVAVEELGSEVFVYMEVSGAEVVCKIDHQQALPKVSQICWLKPDMSKCHLFDNKTEHNIFF